MLLFWSDICKDFGLQAGGQVVIKSKSELGFAMKQSMVNFRGDAVMDVTQSVVELMNNDFIGNGTIMTGMGVQQAKVLTSLMAIAYSKSVIERNR